MGEKEIQEEVTEKVTETEEEYVEVVGDTEEVYNEKEEEVK